MPKALIYCRVKFIDQTGHNALSVQESTCRQFASERGFAVDGVMVDVCSGMTFFDRSELSRLRVKIQSGETDAVICYFPDRISRDAIHLAIFEIECEKANVPLFYATKSELSDVEIYHLLSS